MALGKGLASLIPQRGKDAEETLEKIDSMEFEEETVEIRSVKPKKVVEEKTEEKEAVKKSLNVVEEFSDLDEMEDSPPPARPLVTPLTIDPESGQVQTVSEEEIEVIKAEEKAKVEPKKAAVTPVPAKAETEAWDTHEEKVVQVPIGDIRINPLQPRREFDPEDMAELKESIDLHGILQPLVIRRLADESYELIAGERRLRAAKELKWERVPCVVRTDVSGTEKPLVYALIENLQRENLNPIEVARAFEQLNKEYGMTHEEIGEAMGSSRVRITNAMRVLQLPAEIQRGLSEGKIMEGHARAILMIPDPEKQIRFYHHMVNEGLTVRKAEVRARRIQRAMKIDDPQRIRRRRQQHPLASKLMPKVEEHYGFTTSLKHNSDSNRFELTFWAFNEGELHHLIGRLLGTEALPQGVDEDIIGKVDEEETGGDDDEE